MRFSLPANRYLKRHQRLPVGAISRYRPRPSNRRTAFFPGAVFWIFVVVSSMGQLRKTSGLADRLPPTLPPRPPSCQWTRIAGTGRVAQVFYCFIWLFIDAIGHRPTRRRRPRMVGWWARSDSNRGPRDSLESRRFRREWTISSPV